MWEIISLLTPNTISGKELRLFFLEKFFGTSNAKLCEFYGFTLEIDNGTDAMHFGGGRPGSVVDFVVDVICSLRGLEHF